jgi:alkylation response protein AidB-like acyl-CoA dehydrogenase
MDFAITEAQRELGALTRQIVAGRQPAGDFDRALWRDLAGAGVLAATLPKEAGGDGYGLLEQCTVLVELGRAVAAVPYLSSIVTAASAVARFGDRAQCDRWAEPAGRGQLILTAALGDEGVVRAERTADGWTLTGSKSAVPAAPVADAVLVPALLDDPAGAGAAVFVVTPDAPGITVEAQEMPGGEGAGWLELAGAHMPPEAVLGGVGAAAAITASLAAHATVGLCAAQLGVTERALELTAGYAATRVQFGRPIGSFQAVAQRLADAYIDVEAIRLTMWQAAWRLAEGLPGAAEIATAKFWAADGGHRVAHAAVHVHGGVGIDLEYPLHRYFLAAKHHEFALGGATAQLRRLGTLLAD